MSGVTDSDPSEPPVLEGDLIDPAPPPVVEPEIIDADVIDDEPAETVPEYVVVAEPVLDEDDPAPRPFDATPRVTRHAPTPRTPRSDVDSVIRRPWLALPVLLLLALAGAFFAWVSAEPFWLSVGHGEAGTAVVVASANGCRATFAGATFTRSTVELAGTSRCTVGASMPARMVSSRAGRAFVIGGPGLRLRWAIGSALVVLCGLLVACVIGIRPYRGWPRAGAMATGVGAPLAVAAALLAAAY
jgi:hypothetical protein